MAAAAGDRLSNLSDDLLIHILSYAPSREAATTAALSRRWRHRLWLEASAVNLDYRSYPTADGVDHLRWMAESDAEHARALLRSSSTKPAAAARRVAVVMRGDTMHDRVLRAATGNEDEEEDGVEELFLDCTEDAAAAPLTESSSSSSPCCYYELSLHLLPSAALRILDLKGCNVIQRWRLAVFFPCLEALRLRRCAADLEVLQGMVDAAPKLDDLRIEHFTLQHGCADPARLRCPAAAVSVVDTYLPSCHYDNMRECAVELHAPRIRCAKLVQTLSWNADAVLLSFKPPPASMAAVERVHLELHHAMAPLRCVDPRVFRRTKALKLTVYSMADLNLNAGHDDLPPVFFPNLERLEIEELTTCGSPASRAAAVASLLRRCPAIRELRLKSRWRDYLRETVPDPEVRAAAMADFSPCRSVNRDEDDEEAECCNKTLHDLPELNCSRRIPPLNSLRRVAMDFDAEELKLSCVHVRLLRFLAHNGVFLEEVAVAGGKGYDSSHIDRKVSTWMMRSAGRSSSAMLEEEEEDNLQRVQCRCSCCTRAARLSSWWPARSVPEWPPSLLEFPWLLRENFSPPWPSDVGGGFNGLDYYLYLYDDDDWTSPPPRKRNKVWSSPERLTVKLPKAKKRSVVTLPPWIMRGGEEEAEAEGGVCYERSAAASLPAAGDPWYWPPPPPSLSEFPALVPAPPAPPFLPESAESPARAWPEPSPGESSWPDDAPDILTPPWSTSDGEDEWHYMEDDDGDQDWISARHLVHVDRKRKKVWGTPECFTVKLPKANKNGGVAGEGWIRRKRGGGGGATRRCEHWLGEEGGGGRQSCRAAAAPRWPPSLLEFPPLVPAALAN